MAVLGGLIVTLTSQIHGDVFRPGTNSILFSSLLGTGCQLAAAALILILLAVCEKLWTE